MKLLRKLFARRPARRPSRSTRLGCEQLEARELLSGTPLPPPTDLHNPLIASVARAEFLQDKGQLSRTDIINLLDVADGTESPVFTKGQVKFVPATPNSQATLTASQLTDLQTLVQDAVAWDLSAPVANLLGKTVNQNPANDNYQGAPLLPTGQLTAGTSDMVLQDLVGKWFYGTDLPATAAAAANNGIPDNVVYQNAEGVLFGPGGPSSKDIAQGWVGDCYFMSSLGEMAQQSPQTIRSMFINNGDGTYTVRFFEYNAANNTWQAVYVTVNLELPVLLQSGQFAFADWYQGGRPTTYTETSAVLWPALAEKAYAQLAEEGWSRSTGPGGSGINSTPSDWNTNSYDALAYGDGVALQQIGGSNITYDVGLAKASTSDETALEQAFAHGSLVIVGSLGQEPSGIPTNAAGAPLIIAGHVYALTAVDATKGQFTLVNPYDDNGPYPGDGQRTVTLAWSQMKKYLNDYFVVAPPPICPSHAVVQQGQNTGINGAAAAVNIQWFDNGKPIASLSQVHQGDTVTVTFDTLPGAAQTEFSLVAYAAPNGNFNSSNIDHQQEWADTTGTYAGAGQHSLTVTLPDGYFQLDFVQGAAIADFATGERYHSDGRFLAGVQGGTHVVNG
jgi:Calpain family cysteine protease